MMFIKVVGVFIAWTVVGSIVLGLLNAMQNFFDVTIIESIKSSCRDSDDKSTAIMLWSIFWPFAVIAVVPRCVIEIINYWME